MPAKYVTQGQDRLLWKPTQRELATACKEGARWLWGSIAKQRANRLMRGEGGMTTTLSRDNAGKWVQWVTPDSQTTVELPLELYECVSKGLVTHLEAYGTLADLAVSNWAALKPWLNDAEEKAAAGARSAALKQAAEKHHAGGRTIDEQVDGVEWGGSGLSKKEEERVVKDVTRQVHARHAAAAGTLKVTFTRVPVCSSKPSNPGGPTSLGCVLRPASCP